MPEKYRKFAGRTLVRTAAMNANVQILTFGVVTPCAAGAAVAGVLLDSFGAPVEMPPITSHLADGGPVLCRIG